MAGHGSYEGEPIAVAEDAAEHEIGEGPEQAEGCGEPEKPMEMRGDRTQRAKGNPSESSAHEIAERATKIEEIAAMISETLCVVEAGGGEDASATAG